MGRVDSLVKLYSRLKDGFYPAEDYIEHPCNKTAERFIQLYYSNRCKESIFDFDLSEKAVLYSKSSHTVSAFLMGMCFKSLVEEKVKNVINEKGKRDKKYSFEYPWFLCCLYHDTYSLFERQYGITSLNSFESMRRTMGIEHEIHVLEKDVYKNWDWPLTYKRRTIEDYYRQRYKDGCVDHGILSGVYCFDRLVKNYLVNRKEHDSDCFTTNGEYCRLRWDRKQIRVFAIAADAIIAHNIWHVKNSYIPEICLNGENERKLSIIGTPLAYYLSLIDTIEPAKWFSYSNRYSDMEILDNICIQLTYNIIRITQTDGSFDFKDWYNNKMRNIPDWLEDTKAYLISDNEILISLPQQ